MNKLFEGIVKDLSNADIGWMNTKNPFYMEGYKYVKQLLNQLELDRVVSIESDRVNSSNLSTGQKKRLAMLTACMEGRSILVLDEWAADQDPRFKKIFYEILLPNLKAKSLTLIVISHDDRYCHVADRLVSLENGTIDVSSVTNE